MHLNIPEDSIYSIYQIEDISLKRLSPDTIEECVLLGESQNGFIFEDMGRFTEEKEREYEFRNVQV